MGNFDIKHTYHKDFEFRLANYLTTVILQMCSLATWWSRTLCNRLQQISRCKKFVYELHTGMVADDYYYHQKVGGRCTPVTKVGG